MGYEISSYVQSIYLAASDDGFNVQWDYIDHDESERTESHSLIFSEWPANLPVAIQNLQAAHVAEYGIRNRVGARLDLNVYISEIQGNLTYDEYVKRGGVPILERDGYAKWLTKQYIEGQFMQHGSLLSPRGVKFDADLEIGRKQVAGGLVSLGDWITRSGGKAPSTSVGITDDVLHFTLFIRVPEFEAVSAASAHTDYAPLVGLIALLNGNKAMGDSITGTGANPFGAPSTHRYRVRDHANTELFQIAPTFHSSGIVSNNLVWLSLHFVVTNAPDTMAVSAQISAIHNWVQRVITAPSDQRVFEDNHIGSREGQLYGIHLNLSDQVRMDGINGIPRFWVPVEQAHIPVHAGTHRILDHDQLTPVLDDMMNETHRVLPPNTEQPMVHEVHYHGSEAAALRLPKPADRLAASGSAYPLAVGSTFADYEVMDPAGGNIVTLKRGERADLSLVWDQEGRQRIVGNVPRRRMIKTRGSGGVLNDRGYWAYSSTQWARPVKMPAPSYVNEDAFEVPTTDTDAGSGAFTADNYNTGRDSFIMRKSGEVIFYRNVRFEVVGSGTLPHGMTTLLTFKRGDTIFEQALNVYDEITGAGSIYELTWLWIGGLQTGDVVQPIFTMPRASTLNIGAATVRQAYEAVILDQHVIYEVTA